MNKDIEVIKALGLCKEELEWLEMQPSLEAAYNTCHRGDWLLWLLDEAEELNEHQAVAVGVKFAEQTLPSFEEKHPGDNRPRQALEAVKRWLFCPTKENREAVTAAEREAARAKWAVWATLEKNDARHTEQLAQANIIRATIPNPWRSK